MRDEQMIFIQISDKMREKDTGWCTTTSFQGLCTVRSLALITREQPMKRNHKQIPVSHVTRLVRLMDFTEMTIAE